MYGGDSALRDRGESERGTLARRWINSRIRQCVYVKIVNRMELVESVVNVDERISPKLSLMGWIKRRDEEGLFFFFFAFVFRPMGDALIAEHQRPGVRG